MVHIGYPPPRRGGAKVLKSGPVLIKMLRIFHRFALKSEKNSKNMINSMENNFCEYRTRSRILQQYLDCF